MLGRILSGPRDAGRTVIFGGKYEVCLQADSHGIVRMTIPGHELKVGDVAR